jgi:hypothetical protein
MRNTRWSTFVSGAGLAALALLLLGPTGARADEAPALPSYMSVTSPDPAKPLWPDPTGANAG